MANGRIRFRDNNEIRSSGAQGFYTLVDGVLTPIGSGSGGSGASVANVVYQTGNQDISGEKAFKGDIFFEQRAYFGSNNSIFDNLSAIAGGDTNRTNSSYTFIGGGQSNEVTGDYSSVVGGISNDISGDASFIGGGDANKQSGNYNSIVGGGNNLILGSYSFVGGGANNFISGNQIAIVGGTNNSSQSIYSFVGGGSNNTIGASSEGSIIIGGELNSITGILNTIGGGGENVIAKNSGRFGTGDFGQNTAGSTVGGGGFNQIYNSDYGLIAGGFGNEIATTGSLSNFNSIGGGNTNYILYKSINSTIAGGKDNEIHDSTSATVMGGEDNFIYSGNCASIFGGKDNLINSGAAYSSALGRRATVSHSGASVFADGQDRNHGSFGDNTISLDYSGGAFFYLPQYTGSLNAHARGLAASGGSLYLHTGTGLTDWTVVNSSSSGSQQSSNTIGLLDRFDNTGKHYEGETIVHMVSTPEVGPAWRLNTGASSTDLPKITGQGLLVTGFNSLFYLGNRIPTPNNRFSVGFEWSFEPTAYQSDPAGTGVQTLGLNISFHSGDIISTGGGISPNGAFHANINTYGVNQISLFPSSPVINANRSTPTANWHPSGYELLPSKRYSTVLKASGDYVEMTTFGVGSILFYRSGMSNEVYGPETSFWWEGIGSSGTAGRYRYVPKLYRVWAEAEELNDAAAYGNGYSATNDYNTLGPFTTRSRVRYYPTGSKVMGDGMPSDNFPIIIGGNGPTSVPLQFGTGSVVSGGYVYLEGGVLSNVGGSAVGASVIGKPISCISTTNQEFLTGAVYSTTGTLAVLRNLPYTIQSSIGNQERWEIRGLLSGTGAKRIFVDLATYGNTVFDSDTTSTPLSGVTGAYKLEIFRQINYDAPHLFYSSFELPDGTKLPTQRRPINNTFNNSYLQFRTTTPAASGVSIDSINRTFYKNSVAY